MNAQLSCNKFGHNNKLIQGICMSKSCKSDQRIFCITCLTTLHADCKNQFYEKDDFIRSLQEFKVKTLNEKEPEAIFFLRELVKQSQQFIKLLEQFAINIHSEYARINPIDRIDLILSNQQTLTAMDWNEGYKLLIQKEAIFPQSTKELIDELNKIKESIDCIPNLITKEYEQSQILEQPIVNAKWNNINASNPVIINPNHEILSIALSPDGQHIASAGGMGDYSICIWNPMTGKQVGNSLNGHTRWIQSINYSKCSQYIVSCSDDTTIRQWSLSNYQQFGQAIIGHQNAVRGVEYSPNQKYIVSCSPDHTLRFWESKTGKELIDKQIKHPWPPSCLSLSPIKNEVAFGDDAGTIMLWDYENHKQSGQLLNGHVGRVSTIKYSKKSEFIISGSDLLIILWDAYTKRKIQQFSGHTNSVRSVNFSPDQKYIISGGSVIIWDRVTGKQIVCLTPHQGAVRSTQFSLCGNYIITGAQNRQIKIMINPIDQ